jgi:hypothetical protein
MCELVAGVVEQVPSNTIIEKDENEGKEGGDGSKERDPSLSIKIREVDEPVAATIRFNVRTILREGRHTASVAAHLSWDDRVGDVEALDFDIIKESVGKDGPDKDREDHGKVADDGSPSVVGKVWREL